jgi:dihydroxy-acid dehydratase
MDAKSFDKTKRPNRHVTEGPARAPHRSYCYARGGPQIMRARRDGRDRHEDRITVTGRTIKQTLEDVKFNIDQKVVYSVSDPISKSHGVVRLLGSVRAQGAMAKVAGMSKLQLRGPARGSDCQENCVHGVKDCVRVVANRQCELGDPLLIGDHGPMATAAASREGVDDLALLSHGRFSGATRGFIGQVGAAAGDPLGLVNDADMISIGAARGRLDLATSEPERASRRQTRKAPAQANQSGVVRTYADQVGSARKGAVTHAGGRAELVCYADI